MNMGLVHHVVWYATVYPQRDGNTFLYNFFQCLSTDDASVLVAVEEYLYGTIKTKVTMHLGHT